MFIFPFLKSAKGSNVCGNFVSIHPKSLSFVDANNPFLLVGLKVTVSLAFCSNTRWLELVFDAFFFSLHFTWNHIIFRCFVLNTQKIVTCSLCINQRCKLMFQSSYTSFLSECSYQGNIIYAFYPRLCYVLIEVMLFVYQNFILNTIFYSDKHHTIIYLYYLNISIF